MRCQSTIALKRVDRWLFILTRLAGAIIPLCSVLWLQQNKLDSEATIIITAITLAAALVAIVTRGQHTTAIFDQRCGHLATSSSILAASMIPTLILEWSGYIAYAAIWMGAVGLYLTLVSEIYYRSVRADVRANITFLKIPIVVGAISATITPYYMHIVGLIGLLTYLTALKNCKSKLKLSSNKKTNVSIWLNSIANYGIANADVVIALNILSTQEVVVYFILKRCFMAVEPLFVSMTAALNRDLRDAQNPEMAHAAIKRHLKNMLLIATIWSSGAFVIVLFNPSLFTNFLEITPETLQISYGFLCAILFTASSSGLGYAFVYFNQHNENLFINIMCLLSILSSAFTFKYFWPESPVQSIVASLLIGLAIKSILSLRLLRLTSNL